MPQGHVRRVMPVLALMLAALLSGPAGVIAQEEPPLLLGSDPRIEDADLRVTRYADGLNFPAGLAVLTDGSLLVGSSNPVYGSYFGSVGQVLRFVDADDDGVADGPGQVIADDLRGGIVALAVAGDLLAVTSTAPGEERITLLRKGAEWSQPVTEAGVIRFTFLGAAHTSYGLAVRETPGEPGAYDLVFNIGASGNETHGQPVEIHGLIETTLQDASLYMVTLRDAGDRVFVSEPVLLATGLRNVMGMAFEPTTGDLLLAENGIDGLENPLEAHSADELNRIPADQIGGAPEDFGFPESYVRYPTGEVIAERGIAPEVAFLPLDGSQSEGPAHLAIAPANFPDGLNNGVYIGFHGQYDLTGGDNEENPLVYVDLETGEYIHFVPNEAANVGHLDSLVSTEDALFVADLCATGTLSAQEPCGVVYRIVGNEE